MNSPTLRVLNRKMATPTTTIKLLYKNYEWDLTVDTNTAIRLQNEKGEDTFELIDLAEYAKKQRWWNRVFGQNSGPIAEKYSVATQIAIGGVTGWCAGFLFKKVGKVAASAVGGGFFLLQIANHTGYITVDWKRVEQDVKKAKKQLKLGAEKSPKEVRTKVDEVRRLNVHSATEQLPACNPLCCQSLPVFSQPPIAETHWGIMNNKLPTQSSLGDSKCFIYAPVG
ncbi:FUND1 protein, partial [Polyodon spathula]|nr:FUND1 protein [Polyodon spathula]